MALGLCRFTNDLGGTADFIYPGPSIDMQSPASAGAVNGTTYVIYAQSFDMTQWEISRGVYTAGTQTFARTTVSSNSEGTTSKIDFDNPPQVFVFDTFPVADLSAYSTTVAMNAAIASAVNSLSQGQCKFVYVDTTHVALIPFNGDKIKINGVVYSIPATGIAITNSGLSANTTYLAYLQIVSGSPALTFSTTAHATSATAGNVGVEVKSGSDTNSLVGIVRTDASGLFADTMAQRFVRSWFNRTRTPSEGAQDTSSTDTTTGSYVQKTVSKAEFVSFSDDEIEARTVGILTNTGAGATASGLMVFIDGSQVGDQCDTNISAPNIRSPVNAYTAAKLAEGYHFVTFGLRALGGGTASATYGLRAKASIG